MKGGIKFRATLEEVRDILVLERKAVEREDGKEFVYVLDGDTVQKRFIKTAEGTVDVWVLDGLTEGQTLIVD